MMSATALSVVVHHIFERQHSSILGGGSPSHFSGVWDNILALSLTGSIEFTHNILLLLLKPLAPASRQTEKITTQGCNQRLTSPLDPPNVLVSNSVGKVIPHTNLGHRETPCELGLFSPETSNSNGPAATTARDVKLWQKWMEAQ